MEKSNIEKGIPVPENLRRTSKGGKEGFIPYQDMEVGDSILIRGLSLKIVTNRLNAKNHFNKQAKTSGVFRAAKEKGDSDMIRVWRVE